MTSMDRSRLIRWLRISASAVCLIICFLLIVLWVRSYWKWDQFDGYLSAMAREFKIESMRGELIVREFSDKPGWALSTRSLKEVLARRRLVDRQYEFASIQGLLVSDNTICLPLWIPVALAAALAYVPWLPWPTRFSLRTMLIATTVFALLLGLVVWWVRR
jgi:hypothetical protein